MLLQALAAIDIPHFRALKRIRAAADEGTDDQARRRSVHDAAWRESAPVRAGLLQVGALQMDTGWGAGVSLTDFGRTLLADVEAAGGVLHV